MFGSAVMFGSLRYLQDLLVLQDLQDLQDLQVRQMALIPPPPETIKWAAEMLAQHIDASYGWDAPEGSTLGADITAGLAIPRAEAEIMVGQAVWRLCVAQRKEKLKLLKPNKDRSK